MLAAANTPLCRSLSFVSIYETWSRRRDLNPRPSDYKTDTLTSLSYVGVDTTNSGADGENRTPDFLITNETLCHLSYVGENFVDQDGIEPSTSCSSHRRSTN
jgi:hypothetical protein